MDSPADLLAREALGVLFRLHPDRFVLIGGGALRFVHGSPRASADLDLHAAPPPAKAELKALAAELEAGLAPLAARLGSALAAAPGDDSITLSLDGRPLVRLDFTAFACPAKVERRLVRTGAPGYEALAVPVLDELLFAKAQALLSRPHPKGRDLFDLWFLKERGARLDEAAFKAWLDWEELDAAAVAARLEAFTPKRLAGDLDRYLPPELRRSLAETGYADLTAAAAELLRPFT